jgi:hypothetical protein
MNAPERSSLASRWERHEAQQARLAIVPAWRKRAAELVQTRGFVAVKEVS